METKQVFYICPVCFQACDTQKECHAHQMVACHVSELSDQQRQPVKDQFGYYVSRAPRWYLEAVGRLRSES